MLFLPETLHQKLPETLRDAEKFGKNQPFWYLPRPVHRTGKQEENEEDDDKADSEGATLANKENGVTEKLNQSQFAP